MNKPNVILFFVDDLGYGDISCLNEDGKIKTPNVDSIAKEGMIFTDAHSTSAVCSPSRYGILTGRYNWRSSLQSHIVKPYGDPLIDADRKTAATILSESGYYCGCIGKWHLGMGWDFEITKDFIGEKGYGGGRDYEDPYLEPTKEQLEKWNDAFSKPVKGGPLEAGFDSYFGVDIPNWPPYCFIEDDHTVGIPSAFLPPRLIGNALAAYQGPAMPYWHFEQLLPTFERKAQQFIKDRKANDEPFFLYMPFTSPHTPIAVNKRFIGKSGLDNLYADLVIETDDVIGNVLKTLEEEGLKDNTLVIFSSDNGCAPYIGVDQMESRGHYPSYIYRGYKSDVWDGGHRMPLIMRWPEVIKANTSCNQLVSLVDIAATFADMVNANIPDDCLEDSVSLLPLLNGEDKEVRKYCVMHSVEGKFAIREGKWKLLLCPGSGGWAKNDIEAYRENLPMMQLYDMQNDPSETNNVWMENKDVAKRLYFKLLEIIENGRSTDGIKQKNDVEIDLWKLKDIDEDAIVFLDDF